MARQLNPALLPLPASLPVEGLLGAVVAACECLVQHADLLSGLQAAVEQLGRLSAHDRAYVWELTDEQTVCVLVAEWDAPGIPRATNMAGTDRFAVADFKEVWTPLMAGQAYQSVTPVKTGANARLNETVANRSDLMVPIFVGTQCWGCIGFDNCTEERRYSAGEIQALRGAAAAISAAVQRCDLDAKCWTAERQRTDDAALHAARIERHSRLLAAVAESAEALLACADPADCMGTVLACVGTVSHAERVCLARLDWTPQDPALHGWQTITCEWARPGLARQIDGALHRFAMQRGDVTWDRVLAQFANERRIKVTIDSQDEPFRSEQMALGVVWNLCYPVLLEGNVWGLLGMDFATEPDDYDEADLAALQTVATTIADALLRRLLEQRALAAERARAEEAQALNQLLESVVQSSRELLDAPDFKVGLQQWLQVLARAVDADVALLGSLAPSVGDEVVAMIQVHWAKHGDKLTPPVPLTTDFIDWHARLQRGEAVWAQREDLLDPASVRYWHEIGCCTKLLVPVVGAMGTLAFMGFDWRKRREWQPAYGTVLRTAADLVAAVIQRHEATQSLLAEQDKRITIEFELRQESTRLATLIGHIVRSSRALIDAELHDFESALLTWLGECGRASHAIRMTFYDLVEHAPSGLRTLRALSEWVRDGVGASLPVSFAHPLVLDPRGAEAHMSRLTSGDVLAVHADETAEPMRTYLEQQGNATVVAVPLFIGGQQWGCLSFDYGVRKEATPSEIAVLQTAADTLAAILRRNEATRALLAERELRIEEEQRRSSELARANEALRISLAALAETPSEASFVSRCLLQICQQANANAAYLFRFDEPSSSLHRVGAAAFGQFHTAGLPDDPTVFRTGFHCESTLRAQLTDSGRLLWRPLQSSTGQSADARAIARWQAQQGYCADALHALLVDRQMVGLVALQFSRTEPPSIAQQELTNTLCQTLTLAIELARLGSQARLNGERSAVLGERQRMAGEIHDSLAQSFTSIAMQGESLANRLGDETEAMRVLQMIVRTAREGLASARSSVLALLPTASAAGSLDATLVELAARSSVPGGIQCTFSSQGTPAVLPESVREALLRIAQEATSNAMRHSGGSQIVLRLVYASAELNLTVEDNGDGPQRNAGLKANGGFGMAGMQARAEAVGACMLVSVAAMGGYSVQVSLTQPVEAMM